MTLSLACIPVLFMGGVLGRLFREFGHHLRGHYPRRGVGPPTPMLCSRLKTQAEAGGDSFCDPATSSTTTRPPSRAC
jgi:hypothetical protein